jgi:hypothetical protein
VRHLYDIVEGEGLVFSCSKLVTAALAESTVGANLYQSVQPPRPSPLYTIMMSNERPSDNNCIRKIAACFKRKLSSLLHSSRAPISSSIVMGSSSDNRTK